jgi:hypothetical protein
MRCAWDGCDINAQIELPTDRVREFLASLPAPRGRPIDGTVGVFQGPHNPAWWRPPANASVAVHFFSTRADLKRSSGHEPMQGVMDLWIATRRASASIVYLAWSSV